MADTQADGEPVVQRKSKKTLALLSLKRTFDLFAGNYGQRIPTDTESQKLKLACKVRSRIAAAQPQIFQSAC